MKYKKSVGENIFDGFNILLMVCIFIVMLYPLIYVVTYSLSSTSKLTGGFILWPRGFTLENYAASLQVRGLVNGIWISTSRTILGTVVVIIFNSMAAYVLSRREVLGVAFFKKFFVVTMYFSGGLIPFYMVVRSLGMTNSYWVYIIPGIISVYYMILIRTYIESLPEELHDAAVVDGANDYVLFFRILFPLLKPILATVGLFAAIGAWNSYVDTALFNSMTRRLFPLQYILYNFLSTAQNLTAEDLAVGADAVSRLTRKGLNMSITVITILPIACIYPFVRKYFTAGLLVGSIKG